MPRSDTGNSSRRPFLVALAGLVLAPLFGRTDAAALSSTDVAATSDQSLREAFVGQVILIPYDWIPRGYLECDGSDQLISEHSALFALLGTKYGGDGRRTFAVPSIRAPRGLRYVIASSGIYPSRH